MGFDGQGALFSESLAAELKWQLKARGVSNSALARALGMPSQRVGLWLNGQFKIPLSFAYAACLWVGYRPASLFEIAQRRMSMTGTLFITGTPEAMEPSSLPPAELVARGEFFVECVSAELREALASHGLSVRQLALRFGRTPTVAGDWLNAKTVIPAHFAFSTCQAVGMSMAELVELAEVRMQDLTETEPDTPGAALPQPEDDEFAEAQKRLADVAAKAGLIRGGARGASLTPAAMREIADLIEKHAPQQ